MEGDGAAGGPLPGWVLRGPTWLPLGLSWAPQGQSRPPCTPEPGAAARPGREVWGGALEEGSGWLPRRWRCLHLPWITGACRVSSGCRPPRWSCQATPGRAASLRRPPCSRAHALVSLLTPLLACHAATAEETSVAGNASPSPRRRCMFRSAWLHPACLRLSARPCPWQAGAGGCGVTALVPPPAPSKG